jgi:hypothetical protein
MLEAVPPDYRELDYVPSEFRYVLARTSTAKTLPPPRQDSGVLTDPLNKTASGPFSSFSQETFKKVRFISILSDRHFPLIVVYSATLHFTMAIISEGQCIVEVR